MDSCLTVKNQLPGSDAIPSSSTFNFQDENNADESGSEIESGDEDEVQSSEESDSSSGGESENCPICLLKFKGQAIGFPEVCGHPFCLDCILEWTKNVQTCPNDRQQFNNILVRLDLDGEVVRKIPVQIQNKDEDDVLLEVTECQVCGNSEREDMMLLCDRCDQGYHMDCLVPALEEVPIEDWFCPRCNGHDAVAAPVRQRANLAMRVRRAVQRNRQIALRDSSVGRKRTRKVTKRKSTSKRKSTGKGKQSVGRKKRKVRRKGKGKRRKAAAVPTPRKRIASALVQSDKSFGIQKEPASQFSLFGNPNALDEPADDDSDDEIRRLCSPIKETKSLIAKLAESRKVKKSIYDFGPVALSSAKPGKPIVAATSSVSSANPDLLGSILASQVQLSEFGKPPDAARTKIRAPSNSSRVLAAILASRATLDRLDEDIARLQSSSQCKPIAAPSKDVDQRSGRQQSSDQQGNQSSNNSNNRQQSTGGNSSTNQSNATESNGQTGGTNGSSSNNCGANGGSDGNGDDPNRNQKKKVDSGPKENDAVDDNDKEEDVDLYSDIESVEEEPDLTQNQQTSKAEQEDERMLEDDDEKGLVIDDTEESGRQSTESLSDAKSGNADSRLTEESSEQVEKKEECVPAEGTLLTQAKAVAKKATVEKSQHGGLPAAAAALSVGPRGGVVTRPQLRPRTTQSSVNNSMMNQLMKDNLISSIASALKEQLTSAFRAQAQSESLASSEDSLPAPSYSDTKNPPKVVDNSIIAPLATGVIAKSVSAEAKEPKSASSKRKMQEIFGSDYEDEIAVSKNQTNDLEQVSDCEEGELDESETGEPSDHEDLPLSGNRIVRMLTPPPQSTRQPVKKETKKGKTGQDCEEGEIVDKKRNKKPKPTEEPATPAAAEDGDEDDILRSAGIGGERRVELISVDEGLPSTFKKLDSGKTRRYRHQGEIKVVEGKGDVKVKEESTEGKRPKRTDMKHYSARRVVERSHGEQQTSSKADRSQFRSRSETKPKEKEYSSKKVKSQRKRPASESSTNSSSSSSRSSSFSSLSSLSPEHRGKGKANHHKRSRSSSTESSSKRRRRKAKHRSRNATEDTSKSRDKKKKSSKKKKKRTKSSKERHKDKKVSSDGKANRTSEADPDGEDIEIPSKAVFASGDKIVVSLHFGSSTPSVSKSSVKKKKRKMDTKDHVSSKKMKTEVPSSRSPSPQEQRKKNSQSTPTASKISSDKSNKKTPSTEVKTEQINPPSPSSSPSTPPLPKSPPPAATKKEESLKLNAASTSESSPRRKETSTNSSESSTSVAGRRNEGNVQGRGILRGRGRGRGMLRSSRGGLRTKPVLIDIETSEVIPLDENRPSAVIVLSDSDHSEEDSKTSLDHLPPLPPLPPPPLPPSALCKPSPSVAEPVKPKVQLLRGVKGSLQKKPGAAVKFSLASKANTLKRLNNPLLQLAEAEEENEEGQQQQQQTSLAVSMDKSPVKTTEATSALSETVKSNEEDNFLINLPLPDGPARSKDIRGSPVKMTTTSAGTKAPSPIFRPPTPPLPPSTSTYDPSFPTNSSSGSSSPSLSSSPLPVVAAINKMHLPPPPLPPPPTPPMMPSFPSLRPGTVLIPPITSLPPPPLPPPPLLAGSPFLVHRPPGGLLSGHYQHPTYPPPPIAGLHSGPPPPILPSPVQHHSHQNQGTVAKVPNITSQPPPVVMQTPPVKSGRPMTPPSPTPSEDIFGLSPDSPVSNHEATSRPQPSSSSKTRPSVKFPPSTVGASSSSKFDSLLQGSNHQSKRINRSPSKPAPSSRSSKPSPMKTKPGNGVAGSASASAPSGGASGPLITQEGLEECPSSAVDLQVKEKFLKKLNRQERVVEEVRLALKPYYTTKRVSKGDYKEILRKCVPKICHTKSGEINPIKIKEMVKGYVKKFRYQKKKDDVVVAP